MIEDLIATAITVALAVAGIVALVAVVRSVPGVHDLFARLFHGLGQGVSKLSNWLYSQSEATNRNNGNILIVRDEIQLLIKRLSALYEIPTASQDGNNGSGVYWLHIAAYGLVEKYKAISALDISEIVTRVVYELFWESRGTAPVFYIHSAGPKGFYLLMPFTPLGEQFVNHTIEKDLAAQEAMRQKQECNQRGPLMEEVPVPKSENESPAESSLMEEVPLPGDEDAP